MIGDDVMWYYCRGSGAGSGVQAGKANSYWAGYIVGWTRSCIVASNIPYIATHCLYAHSNIRYIASLVRGHRVAEPISSIGNSDRLCCRVVAAVFVDASSRAAIHWLRSKIHRQSLSDGEIDPFHRPR